MGGAGTDRGAGVGGTGLCMVAGGGTGTVLDVGAARTPAARSGFEARAPPGFLRAGGHGMLFGGSPLATDTVELLYTSPRVTVSSLRNDTCAFL